jgi:hypothetical protein
MAREGDILLLGAGGIAAFVLWKKWAAKREAEEKASFDALVTAAVAEVADKKLPSAGAAPQGPNGPTAAAAPGAAPFVPPAQDTNLWWWPEKEVYVARQNGAWDYMESGVKWATGAKEGEGYLPDDWTYGTKEKIKEGAVEAGKTGVEIATGHDPDEPWIPPGVKWVAFGTLGLGALSIILKQMGA